MESLKNKNVFITGATGGIGSKTVKALVSKMVLQAFNQQAIQVSIQ